MAPSRPARPRPALPRPARPRPARPRPVAMVQVLVGGVLGAMARGAVSQALPTPGGTFPRDTLVVNLVGAFLLGAVVEALVRAGNDTGRRRSARLFLGTGFLGAFTTYSTFAVEADLLVKNGHESLAALYVAVTVLGGLVMGISGIAAGAGGHRWRQYRLPMDPDVDEWNGAGASDGDDRPGSNS